MTLTVQLLESSCVKWKTVLPHVNRNSTSPVFTLKGSRLNFKLYCSWKENMKQEMWQAFLKSSICLGTIRLVTYIEKNDGELQCIGCREVSLSYVEIYCSTFEVGRTRLISNGILEDEVTMVFVFHFEFCSKYIIKDTGIDFTRNSKRIKLGKTSFQPSCLQTLSEDMERIFDEKEHSDMILKCGDRSFFVNKRILSARSQVFAAMFRNKMSQSKMGVILIPDMDASVLEQFLLYVYSGRLDSPSMKSVFHLYRLSDKYAMPSLKRKCASFMVDNLSEGSVCQVLSMADILGDTELLNIAINFAVSREGFLKSDEWNDFAIAHPALAVGVYKKFVMK